MTVGEAETKMTIQLTFLWEFSHQRLWHPSSSFSHFYCATSSPEQDGTGSQYLVLTPLKMEFLNIKHLIGGSWCSITLLSICLSFKLYWLLLSAPSSRFSTSSSSWVLNCTLLRRGVILWPHIQLRWLSISFELILIIGFGWSWAKRKMNEL